MLYILCLGIQEKEDMMDIEEGIPFGNGEGMHIARMIKEDIPFSNGKGMHVTRIEGLCVVSTVPKYRRDWRRGRRMAKCSDDWRRHTFWLLVMAKECM